jgi:hypothetical protein
MLFVQDVSWFQLDLPSSGTLTYTLSSSEPIVSRLYVDALQLTDNELIRTQTWSATPAQSLSLERGTYFLQVDGDRLIFDMSLGFAPYSIPEPSQEPGQMPSEAMVLDLTAGVNDVAGYVGRSDPSDLYSFVIGVDRSLVVTFSDVHGTVGGELYADGAQLGLPLETFSSTAVAVSSDPLGAGRYFFRVVAESEPGSLYTLSISESAPP